MEKEASSDYAWAYAAVKGYVFTIDAFWFDSNGHRYEERSDASNSQLFPKSNHLLRLWHISMRLMIVTADVASNNVVLRRHLTEKLWT